ncbi:hypothetical protein J7E62_06565 [Variovorax paradoxus]|nr:hypothetical protein [Variovorax paradoxus]
MPIATPRPDPDPIATPPVAPLEAEIRAADLEGRKDAPKEEKKDKTAGQPGLDENAPGFIKRKPSP